MGSTASVLGPTRFVTVVMVPVQGFKIVTLPAELSEIQTQPLATSVAIALGYENPPRAAVTCRPSGVSRNTSPDPASATHGRTGPGVAKSSAVPRSPSLGKTYTSR